MITIAETLTASSVTPLSLPTFTASLEEAAPPVTAAAAAVTDVAMSDAASLSAVPDVLCSGLSYESQIFRLIEAAGPAGLLQPRIQSLVRNKKFPEKTIRILREKVCVGVARSNLRQRLTHSIRFIDIM